MGEVFGFLTCPLFTSLHFIKSLGEYQLYVEEFDFFKNSLRIPALIALKSLRERCLKKKENFMGRLLGSAQTEGNNKEKDSRNTSEGITMGTHNTEKTNTAHEM